MLTVTQYVKAMAKQYDKDIKLWLCITVTSGFIMAIAIIAFVCWVYEVAIKPMVELGWMD